MLDVGKADVDVLSSNSSTALRTAAMGCRIEAAALLIERGAKVNPVDDMVRPHLIGHMMPVRTVQR